MDTGTRRDFDYSESLPPFMMTSKGNHLWEAAWGHTVPTNSITVDGETFEYYESKYVDIRGYRYALENIILIRPEYETALKWLIRRSERNASRGRKSPRSVLTGQPGIGKTIFLIWLLIQRLQNKEPTALQLTHTFLLFDNTGVREVPTTGENEILLSPETWALSDSNHEIRHPCDAFNHSLAVVILASSPQSSRWKTWKKENKAEIFIFDVWNESEMTALLTLLELDVRRGRTIMGKWGPCARTVLGLLDCDVDENKKEQDYSRQVHKAANKLVDTLRTSLGSVTELDFSGNSPSSILFVRPEPTWRGSAVMYIPTLEIAKIFCVALIDAKHADRREFFIKMSSHAFSRTVGGWMFENYMHAHFEGSNGNPIDAFDKKGTRHDLAMPSKINVLAGTNDALSSDLLPFYWRPSASNFPGIDAIICHSDGVYALQATVSCKHSDASLGLSKVKDLVNSEMKNKKWHLVFVSPNLNDAKRLRDECTLSGVWREIPVWACELPLHSVDVTVLKRIMDNAPDPFTPEPLNDATIADVPKSDCDNKSANILPL